MPAVVRETFRLYTLSVIAVFATASMDARLVRGVVLIHPEFALVGV